MKKATWLLLLLTQLSWSQTKDVYTFQEVQIKPIFPGGMSFFNQFVAENFVVPKDTLFKGGKMLVDFVIDTTGTLTDIRVLRDIGFKTADQAKYILSQSEKWIPGKQDGKPVKVHYAMPIVLPAYEGPGPLFDHKSIEKGPEYPGGMNAFYQLIMQNFRPPMDENLKGKILASFVVEADGSLSEKKIIKDIGHGAGAELLRVLDLSEKWIPGEKDGNPVRVQYTIPINIGGPE
ncbi:energy transducer TonB [Flavobacterium caeni]|uniref:TonB protein C-terminal n=1 Tax=Flavobacterium caeni TaxID=490189 RepID=A0A1G5JU71_9FLAO|nr:energy transducer TonB [Flavobacterium caeni]SCY91877.1 TonB protein C-terminal [Flavobacterium caeni]